MLPPLPRCSGRAYSSLKLAHLYQPSPKPLSGRPAHRPFRGLLGVHSRCGLHTRAVTKTVTVIEGFRHFVTSMPAPAASGWSGRRAGLAPAGKAPPCHGARGKPTFARACADGEVAPIPAVQRQSGNLFGTRGRWTSPPPPSDSLQASDFNHSRASFFSPSVS